MTMILKILSPEREVLSTEAELVELPGSMGRFEVLRDHASLISSLDAGTIRYVKDGQDHQIECKPGFVEVRDNVITVCVG